jgi:hypothetical protein
VSVETGKQQHVARRCPLGSAARYIGDNMPSARGRPLPREAFDAWADPHGALVVGSPQQIVEKLLWEHQVLGHDRFLAPIGLGGLPFADSARSIELLATEVLPVIRHETTPTPASSGTPTLAVERREPARRGRFSCVRRQGLEPRTCRLRVRLSASTAHQRRPQKHRLTCENAA